MILDTNALSAFADGDAAAVARIEEADSISIPAVVLGEFWYGVALSNRKADYERWLSAMIQSSRVLAVTENTARCYAQLRVDLKRAGAPIPANDVWIAALCLEHSLPLLTRDKHFAAVKAIQCIDW